MSNLFKRYYDIAKLVIWGEDINEGETTRKSKLIFSFRDGNPRITVYTGVTGPEGVISFPSDYPTMVTIMSMLKDIARGQPGEKSSIDSLTAVYENNKPTKEKKIVSTLYIGKSKEGLVYFSVISENKPKLVFTIKSSPYHIFRDGNKNVINDSSISEKMAIGIADLVLNIISSILVDYTNEEYTESGRKPLQIKGNVTNQASTEAIPKDILQTIDDLEI